MNRTGYNRLSVRGKGLFLPWLPPYQLPYELPPCVGGHRMTVYQLRDLPTATVYPFWRKPAGQNLPAGSRYRQTNQGLTDETPFS